MYRFLLSGFIDILILGAAMMAALRIGGRPLNISRLIGVFALCFIVNIVRGLPALRMLSAVDKLRRTANEENQDEVLDIMNRNFKPTPLFSVQTFIFAFVILGLGLIMRALR